MTILLIEDNDTIIKGLSYSIEKKGYEFKYRTSVKSAGRYVEENAGNIDLIILDIMLPKVNGLDILRKIKDKDIKSKVIMLTAKGELEDKLLGFSEGANDYVSKLSNAVKGNSNIDFNGYKLYVNGEAIN